MTDTPRLTAPDQGRRFGGAEPAADELGSEGPKPRLTPSGPSPTQQDEPASRLVDTWPHGHRAALALSFDVDAETGMESLGVDLGERPSVRSHQVYGPTVGVPRLLDVLAGRGLRATFFVPGLTAERHPAAVEAILAAGHEVGHHGYTHEQVAAAPVAAQREELERGLGALERIGGVRPTGYRAPWSELPNEAGRLLIEYGFDYDSSRFGADHPYLWYGDRLVELPVSWALDDWERYAFWPGVTGTGRIQRPSGLVADWHEEIAATADVGGLSILTMHPFLSGRPSRAAALAALLDELLAAGDLWIATLDEIASHARTTLAG